MQLHNLKKGKLTKPSSSPKGPHIRLHCLHTFIAWNPVSFAKQQHFYKILYGCQFRTDVDITNKTNPKNINKKEPKIILSTKEEKCIVRSISSYFFF